MAIAVEPVIKIARQAGEAIMEQLVPDLEVSTKGDGSPYTAADICADSIVSEGLKQFTPSIPVLSEEGSPADQQTALRSPIRWVVDPLDGSRTSISYANGQKTHDGFGVHIALVENDVPVLGVVYFPAKGDGGTLYYTGNDGAAYRQEGHRAPQRIRSHPLPLRVPLRVAVSWAKNERPSSIAGRTVEHVPEVGGGRICAAAEGKVDIAFIESPYSPWDVAAAHAILKAAGGELIITDTGKPVSYNDKNLSIPPCMGGNTDALKLLKLANDLPKQGRKL